jgi:hypothetical protein
MKILSLFSDKMPIKGEGRITEIAGKYHRLSHQNGLIEVSFNLPPDQRAAFDARSAELERALKTTIAASTDTMNAKVAGARKEAEAAVTAARAQYDASVFALFGEFGKIPSREALITHDTPVDHVVRLPESAIVQPSPKAVLA